MQCGWDLPTSCNSWKLSGHQLVLTPQVQIALERLLVDAWNDMAMFRAECFLTPELMHALAISD